MVPSPTGFNLASIAWSTVDISPPASPKTHSKTEELPGWAGDPLRLGGSTVIVTLPPSKPHRNRRARQHVDTPQPTRWRHHRGSLNSALSPTVFRADTDADQPRWSGVLNIAHIVFPSACSSTPRRSTPQNRPRPRARRLQRFGTRRLAHVKIAHHDSQASLIEAQRYPTGASNTIHRVADQLTNHQHRIIHHTPHAPCSANLPHRTTPHRHTRRDRSTRSRRELRPAPTCPRSQTLLGHDRRDGVLADPPAPRAKIRGDPRQIGRAHV